MAKVRNKQVMEKPTEVATHWCGAGKWTEGLPPARLEEIPWQVGSIPHPPQHGRPILLYMFRRPSYILLAPCIGSYIALSAGMAKARKTE